MKTVLAMTNLACEVSEWNTPVVGAFLLWHFSLGYKQHNEMKDCPVVILHFIAMGILSSCNFLDKISRRRSNLEAFIRSFYESNQSDLLACLQQRIKSKMAYTSAAIDIAVSSGLLFWDYDKAILCPTEPPTNTRRGIKIGDEMKKMAYKAEILGEWFSEHDISSITLYLGVVL